jgi:hypothetical protein
MCGNRQWIVGVAIALGLAAIVSSSPSLADEWRVTVRGADTTVGESPVVTEIPASVPKGVYQLQAESGGDPVSAQVFEHGEKHFLAFVLRELAGSRPMSFSLKMHTGQEESPAKGVSIREHGENLEIHLDQKSFTEYRVDSGSKPIFFPLIGPTGDPFTRAFPMVAIPGEDDDHPHQRSCWFTFGKVNGIDFWAEGEKFGKIKETHRTLVTQGPVLARLATQDDWLAPDGKRVCSDERTVTFYRTAESRVIDFEFTIQAPDGPVTFGDTKEGMFGIRVASSMDVKRKLGGKITNAEGVTDEKAWGKPSPWVDYVGPVNQKTVGIAILNHPESFRYPTAWHVRPYGLFAANPFGSHDFGGTGPGEYIVPKGETIAFRYRVILHEGNTEATRLDRSFAAYARPPTVELAKK